VTPADLSALWDAARATLTARVDIELWHIAREGHVNRDSILVSLLPEECPTCGSACATPASAIDDDARREAIGKLAVALKEGGAT
jgi:hypothetical protein